MAIATKDIMCKQKRRGTSLLTTLMQYTYTVIRAVLQSGLVTPGGCASYTHTDGGKEGIAFSVRFIVSA